MHIIHDEPVQQTLQPLNSTSLQFSVITIKDPPPRKINGLIKSVLRASTHLKIDRTYYSY